MIWEENKPVDIKANSSADFFEARESEFLKGIDSKNQFFVTELYDGDQLLSSNVFYFRPVKELYLPSPKVDYDVSAKEGGFIIKLKSEELAKNVFLTIEDEDGFFSDNYFDMLPGTKVTVELNTKIAKEKLDEVLLVHTLDQEF